MKAATVANLLRGERSRAEVRQILKEAKRAKEELTVGAITSRLNAAPPPHKIWYDQHTRFHLKEMQRKEEVACKEIASHKVVWWLK